MKTDTKTGAVHRQTARVRDKERPSEREKIKRREKKIEKDFCDPRNLGKGNGLRQFAAVCCRLLHKSIA